MDNLTHALTGLMLARAGFDRITPHAALLMMLSANVPDIDVAAAAFGSPAYLDAHRAHTHSLAFLPLMAALPVFACRLHRVRGAWIAAMAGVLSHLLLDWTNIYGIRLLLPFSDRWFRLDMTPVADPWIWALLGFGVLWPLLARLVAAEIGSRRKSGAGLARVVLVSLLAYEGFRFVLHDRALEVLNSRVYGGEDPGQVAALPDFANPLRWRGLIELSGSWQVHSFHLARDFDPGAGRILYKAEAGPAIEAARGTPAFQAIERFSRTLLWQAVPASGTDGVTEVTAVDLRFALPGEGRFTARAAVEAGGRVVDSGFRFIPKGGIPQPR